MSTKASIWSLPCVPVDETLAPQALGLWNRLAGGTEIPHKTLNAASFSTLFLNDAGDVARIALAAVEDGRLLGFAAGNLKEGTRIGYLTFVMVEPEARRRGIGTALAGAVETELLAMAARQGAPLEFLDARFLNPSPLEWVVPGTVGHDHPNAPGVDMSGSGHLFMKNIGFRTIDTVNSYHRALEGFEYSPAIRDSLERLEREGLRIVVYRGDYHTGLVDLIDDLHSDVWRDTLLSNAAKPGGGLPVLIVEDGARVCGFAGPMDVQPSGRGYFNGIGIHSSYRSRGAGKALFSALCMGLKERGAKFMTLFTGETNPARNIYESAGFRIVRSWACMRKTYDAGR